jgi:hypothetical protein
MGMDDRPQLEYLLKEYAALANDRDAVLRKEAEEREAQRKKEQEAEKRRYEQEVADLSLELGKTVNGEYAPTLTRLLKAKDNNALHLGNFIAERHGANAHSYNYGYGISLKYEDCSCDNDKLKIHFYTSHPDGQPIRDRMTPADLLAMVRIETLTDTKLALTAYQYRDDLTKAVAKEIENLRKAEVPQ